MYKYFIAYSMLIQSNVIPSNCILTFKEKFLGTPDIRNAESIILESCLKMYGLSGEEKERIDIVISNFILLD